MGRKKVEGEQKQTRSVRIRPSHQEIIVRKYGSFQNWIEEKLKEENFDEEIYDVEIETQGHDEFAEEISEDDF